MALLADGSLEAWGYNNHGQANVPAYITNAVDIAAGDYHCLALLDNGNVSAWGLNNSGQADAPIQIAAAKAIAAGGEHSLTLCAPPYPENTPVHYVSLDGANVWPYTNWIMAATTIQNAIDAAVSNDTVMVSSGTYDTGSKAVHWLKNRMALTKPITVESVYGPGNTVIKGQGPNGSSAVRCAYVTNGAELIGFTLTGGRTRDWEDGAENARGGGVYCDLGGTIENCIIESNAASDGGGGIATLNAVTFMNCVIRENNAYAYGGGVHCNDGGAFTNCLITGNSSKWGAGLYCTLGVNVENCTISGNSASESGGGVFARNGGILNNCIIWNNSGGGNWHNDGTGMTYTNCCTTPTIGVNCITDDPMLVSGTDFYLQSSSPCIDAGTNQPWMVGATDLEGNIRIIDAKVDIGAYEYVKIHEGSPIHYVSVGGANIWPHTNWATAATDIQYAINTCTNGDTVMISSGTYLTATELTVDRDLYILGPGADTLAISGNNSCRVFNIAAGHTVEISGLTIRDGHAPDGSIGLWDPIL